jgi:hypothetical protein
VVSRGGGGEDLLTLLLASLFEMLALFKLASLDLEDQLDERRAVVARTSFHVVLLLLDPLPLGLLDLLRLRQVPPAARQSAW